MDNVVLFVPGEPRGKGRPRFNRATGRAYTDAETRAYEQKIVAYYREAVGAFRFPDSDFLSVRVSACLPIPKGASKATAGAMISGKILPARKPDVDNVLKVVLDALNGVAYKDDARCVDLSASKRYAPNPGVFIYICKIGGD